MDHAWRLWQADFETVLEHLQEPIEHLAQLAASIGGESRRLQLYQEMADYLNRSGDSSEPPAYKSLPARYTHFSQREASRRRVQQVLSQKFAEVSKWCERHEEAFQQIRSEFVPSSTAKLRRKLAGLSHFHEPAASFLENAGQAPLIDQAGATVTRLVELSESRAASLTNCLSILTLYRSHAELHCEEHALADRYRLLRRLLDPVVKQPNPGDIRAAMETYQRHFPREAPPARPGERREKGLSAVRAANVRYLNASEPISMRSEFCKRYNFSILRGKFCGYSLPVQFLDAVH